MSILNHRDIMKENRNDVRNSIIKQYTKLCLLFGTLIRREHLKCLMGLFTVTKFYNQ